VRSSRTSSAAGPAGSPPGGYNRQAPAAARTRCARRCAPAAIQADRHTCVRTTDQCMATTRACCTTRGLAGQGWVTAASRTRPAVRSGNVSAKAVAKRAAPGVADQDRTPYAELFEGRPRRALPGAQARRSRRSPAASSSRGPAGQSGSRDATRRASHRGPTACPPDFRSHRGSARWPDRHREHDAKGRARPHAAARP